MNASTKDGIVMDQTVGGIEQSAAVNTMGAFSVRPKVLYSDGSNVNDTRIMALKADGTVWLWTQEGMKIVTHDDGTPFSGVIDISLARSGGYYAIIRNDNTVWAWGYNGNGYLGISDTGTTIRFPRQVLGVNGVGYLQNIVKIFAGGNNTIAIDSDGIAYGWGYNSYCGLGPSEGSSTSIRTPRLLAGIDNVKSAFLWNSASLFLKNDGTLWAMGRGDHTGTGHAKTATITVPQPVLDSQRNPLTNVREIGERIALLNDGSIWMWGGNWYIYECCHFCKQQSYVIG